MTINIRDENNNIIIPLINGKQCILNSSNNPDTPKIVVHEIKEFIYNNNRFEFNCNDKLVFSITGIYKK